MKNSIHSTVLKHIGTETEKTSKKQLQVTTRGALSFPVPRILASDGHNEMKVLAIIKPPSVKLQKSNDSVKAYNIISETDKN